MKLKYVAITFAIMLGNIGITKAEGSIMAGPQATQVKPVSEVEEPAGVLTSEKEEYQVEESIQNDFSYYDMDCLNLSFQSCNQPDSTDFSVVKYYIKHVVPIMKSIDSKSYDLMEIL